MTVSSSTNRVKYDGNGVTTAFPFMFKILDLDDLVVTLYDVLGVGTVLTRGVDYTVPTSVVGVDTGGTITLVTPPASDEQLLIKRSVDLVQPVDFQNQGRFFPETHERAFDRLLMQVQDVDEKLGRTIRFNEQNDPFPVIEDSAQSRLGRFLTFDADGNPILSNTAVDPSLYYTRYSRREHVIVPGEETNPVIACDDYAPGFSPIEVYINGIWQSSSAFQATTGNSVTLLTSGGPGLIVGDLVAVVVGNVGSIVDSAAEDRAAAEAARIGAEAARIGAEAARIGVEAERDAAEGFSDSASTSATTATTQAAAALADRLLADADVVATAANRTAIEGILNYTPTRDAVRLATAVPIAAHTYNNTAPRTITFTANGSQSVDGFATALNDRILLAAEPTANLLMQGPYYVSTKGTAGVPEVWTAVADGDTGAELVGSVWRVLEGTANANARFRVDQTSITLGTTPITLSMLPSAVAIESAARVLFDTDLKTGLALTGFGSFSMSNGNPTIAGTAATRGVAYSLNTPAASASILQSLSVYAAIAGDVDVVVFYSAYGGTPLSRKTVTLSVGVNTFNQAALQTAGVDISVPVGAIVGIDQYRTDGGAITFNGAGNYLSGASTGASVTLTAQTNALLSFNYTLLVAATYKVPRAGLSSALQSELDGYADTSNLLDLLDIQGGPTSVTLGKASGTVATTPLASGNNLLLFNNTPASLAGTVSQINAYINSVGNGTLLIKAINSGFNVLSQQTITGISATGWQTLNLPSPMSVPSNGFVGYQSTTGDAIVRYDSAPVASPYYFFVGNPGVGTSFTPTGQTTNQAGLFFNYVLSYIATPYVPAAHLDPAFVPTGSVRSASLFSDCPLEMAPNFSALPSGWVNAGSAFTFSGSDNSGKASSGATGLANQLRTGKQYGLDSRRIRWEFEVTNASTAIQFFTNPIEGGIAAGSLITLDTAADTLTVRRQYDGSGTLPAVLSTQPIGFDVTTGNRYVLEWTKSGRSYTVRLFNAANATNQTFTYSRTATPWGYTSFPSFGYDQGAMHGAPGVAVTAGSADFYSFNHTAQNALNPHLYVLGDSITEGFGVPDAFKLSDLLKQDFGTAQIANSGIGGAITAGALARLQAETVSMRPRNALIFLGNNTDASFNANLTTIISTLQSLGTNVAVATVPASATKTAYINGLSGVTKIAWDLELTASGAGSARVAAYYANTDGSGNPYNDNLHPNALGDIHRKRRLYSDWPALIQ